MAAERPRAARKAESLRRAATWPLVAIAATLICGCPPEGKREPVKADKSDCAKVGQTCEFSPGKLGTCVQKDECAAPPCFVCQSQH